MMRKVHLYFLAGLLGCAHAPSESRFVELEHRLKETELRAGRAERKAEDLEDRVFLLTDQVESQRASGVRKNAPPLPVVRLDPQAQTNETNESDADAVAFVGEAQSNDPSRARRSSLTLHGSGPAPASKGARPEASESLGTAPVPTMEDARAHADGDPALLYRSAYHELMAGKPDIAEAKFGEFLRRFPKHSYADNAQYWIGECYYGRRNFERAASEFRAVVTRYPTGNKAPDALLKLGYCLLQLGREKEGQELLAQIPVAYPGTDAARLAEERMASVGRQTKESHP